jgi:uncharacterized protein YndB with AHSA1/START domain
VIKWSLHLASPPEAVYAMLATDEGRARFWAESAVEHDGVISFVFPGSYRWEGPILEKGEPRRFKLIYFGGSTSTFDLTPDGKGGTDLTLIDEGVPDADQIEVYAGWVSVLMALKAAVDFGVDLRNHDGERTWEHGFADN